jgi:hypothetical protein
VLAATVPAVVFSGELISAVYGEGAISPMLALVHVPPLASAFSVLVVPLLAELAEPVAYLGVVLPGLERRLGRPWLAAAIVVAVWAGEHACFPLLASGGGLDLEFAAYRVGSVLPFLAAWTARCISRWGGGCCRSWRPGGCSTAAPRWPWPWAWSDDPAPTSTVTAAGPGPRQSAGMSGSWAGDAKEDEGSVPSRALRRKAAAMLRAPWRRKIAMARGCAGWP